MGKSINYSKITESPSFDATEEQLARLYHRYDFAKQYAEGKDVLEIACGSGVMPNAGNKGFEVIYTMASN